MRSAILCPAILFVLILLQDSDALNFTPEDITKCEQYDMKTKEYVVPRKPQSEDAEFALEMYFSVRTDREAELNVELTYFPHDPKAPVKHLYELMIKPRTELRKGRIGSKKGSPLSFVKTPNIFKFNKFRAFYIAVYNNHGEIEFGNENGSPIISYKPTYAMPIMSDGVIKVKFNTTLTKEIHVFYNCDAFSERRSSAIKIDSLPPGANNGYNSVKEIVKPKNKENNLKPPVEVSDTSILPIDSVVEEYSSYLVDILEKNNSTSFDIYNTNPLPANNYNDPPNLLPPEEEKERTPQDENDSNSLNNIQDNSRLPTPENDSKPSPPFLPVEGKTHQDESNVSDPTGAEYSSLLPARDEDIRYNHQSDMNYPIDVEYSSLLPEDMTPENKENNLNPPVEVSDTSILPIDSVVDEYSSYLVDILETNDSIPFNMYNTNPPPDNSYNDPPDSLPPTPEEEKEKTPQEDDSNDTNSLNNIQDISRLPTSENDSKPPPPFLPVEGKTHQVESNVSDYNGAQYFSLLPTTDEDIRYKDQSDMNFPIDVQYSSLLPEDLKPENKEHNLYPTVEVSDTSILPIDSLVDEYSSYLFNILETNNSKPFDIYNTNSPPANNHNDPTDSLPATLEEEKERSSQDKNDVNSLNNKQVLLPSIDEDSGPQDENDVNVPTKNNSSLPPPSEKYIGPQDKTDLNKDYKGSISETHDGFDSENEINYDVVNQCKYFPHWKIRTKLYEIFLALDDLRPKTVQDAVVEMHFAIKSYGEAGLLLSAISSEEVNVPSYEIVFGDESNELTILKYRGIGNQIEDLEIAKTPGILTPVEFRLFYVIITKDGLIEIGQENKPPFIKYKDDDPIPVKYFSFMNMKPVDATLLYDCPSIGAESSSISDPCKTGAKWQTTMKSKKRGIYCRSCGCEGEHGWTCTSTPGKCNSADVDTSKFCKNAGEIRKEEINDNGNKCRICRCNVKRGWECVFSHQACYNHYPKKEKCNSVLGEVYSNCEAHCHPLCWEPKAVCAPKCVSGCVCAPGLKRDLDGLCKPILNCTDIGFHFAPNMKKLCEDKHKDEVFNICGKQCEPHCKDLTVTKKRDCKSECFPDCTCKNGYMRDDYGRCIPEHKCPALMKCEMDNEVYSKCGETCNDQCGIENQTCNEFRCKPGCTCQPGYRRLANSTCVPIDSCPIDIIPDTADPEVNKAFPSDLADPGLNNEVLSDTAVDHVKAQDNDAARASKAFRQRTAHSWETEDEEKSTGMCIPLLLVLDID